MAINPQDISDLAKRHEYDRLITAAHVSRGRGDYDQAERSILEALKLVPNDPDASEFAADILCARGELEKAAEEYKKLFEEDRSRATAEEKYARVTLQISEARRQQDLLKEMVENPARFRSSPTRSPLIAALLSIAPGFGHIYCGQFVKGVVLFVASMFCWFIFALLSPDLSYCPPEQRFEMFLKSMSAPAVLFACAGLFVQIYAFVDAPVIASKSRENQDVKDLSEPE